ncbi:hypothetical protein [Microbacterium algeriense]|uniref:hypothetical protein n=1 Tax=Microbacterium algeriense TaxID=2615184 RepID=UPI0022E8C184|nr:hypothetical protein [Microbacterium algeriense]
MRTPVAFVDANVLYSKTLRDWLFLLRIETGGGMFVLFSSEDSLEETLYHQRRNHHDAPGGYTKAIREKIREFLDDIVDEFPSIDFPGADKNDHHIHAAATSVNASYLIANDKGFQKIDQELLTYEVHSADSFFMLVAANASGAVDRVISTQLAYFRDKPGAKPLDVRLEAAGCPRFAECVRQHVKKLALAESTHGIADSLLLADAPV